MRTCERTNMSPKKTINMIKHNIPSNDQMRPPRIIIHDTLEQSAKELYTAIVRHCYQQWLRTWFEAAVTMAQSRRRTAFWRKKWRIFFQQKIFLSVFFWSCTLYFCTHFFFVQLLIWHTCHLLQNYNSQNLYLINK